MSLLLICYKQSMKHTHFLGGLVEGGGSITSEDTHGRKGTAGWGSRNGCVTPKILVIVALQKHKKSLPSQKSSSMVKVYCLPSLAWSWEKTPTEPNTAAAEAEGEDDKSVT